MQGVLAQRAQIRATPRRSGDDLVSIASPLLELILQIRAGLVQPSNDLRSVMDELLKQIEQDADALGYKGPLVQAARFALTAFADETVLTAHFALRNEWEKYPLQLEYFGEQLAGVKFYERLDELMKSPEENAEAIEIYYLCLLIGYRGKYNVYFEEQLRGVIEHVADCLRRANRLHTGALSPHWKVNDQPRVQSAQGIPTWAKIAGAGVLGLIVLLYLVFSLLLSGSLSSAVTDLLR